MNNQISGLPSISIIIIIIKSEAYRLNTSNLMVRNKVPVWLTLRQKRFSAELSWSPTGYAT
jgi:hypothetical protein